MENLIFKYKGWGWTKRIIGVIWILLGVSLFFSEALLDLTDWIRSIASILLGISFFSPLMGNNETRFTANDDSLKIIWRTKIGEIIIPNNEIERIIIKNKRIEILRKEKKPVVLLFGEWLWKVDEKKKVYEFLIEYSQQKGIVLEK